MRRDPDVLVIGAGIVGLFSAYYLRQRGMAVTVIDQGPVGGTQSCSSGNTGYIGTTGAVPLAEPGVIRQGLRWMLNSASPFYVKPRLDYELLRWLWHFRRACDENQVKRGFHVLLEMKRKSLEVFRELSASDGMFSCITTTGKLIAFNTPDGFKRGCASAELSLKNGVPLEILTRDQVRALEPEAPFDICGAIFNKEDGYLHLPEFMLQMERRLESMGVEIYPSAAVFDLETANGQVGTISTTRGDFRPQEVVLAAGSGSTALARRLGLRLPLQPAKGYGITVNKPCNSPRLPVLLSEGRVAITPLGDSLRLAGTLELTGMDVSLARGRLEGILKTVRAYLPNLEPTEVVNIWSGLRPCTPDGIPLIGRVSKYRNVTVACGHGHIGMGLSPMTGQLVSQIIAEERPAMDLTPFRVDRYGGA